MVKKIYTGIHLNAESVRAGLQEAPEAHGLTQEQANAISRLDDDVINHAVFVSLNNPFWEAYDNVRRSAIRRLVHQISMKE